MIHIKSLHLVYAQLSFSTYSALIIYSFNNSPIILYFSLLFLVQRSIWTEVEMNALNTTLLPDLKSFKKPKNGRF